MTKTAHDVCETALQEIEVLGVSEDMPADYFQTAKTRYEALFAELKNQRGLVIDWTTETVPDQFFMPMAVAVGAYCARPFGKPVTEAAKALTVTELRAAIVDDDRQDRRPADVKKRAAFY